MKSHFEDDAVPGVNCELKYEDAQAAAGQGAGVRREGWADDMFVVVAYVPAVKLAVPMLCIDGWLDDGTNTIQRYVASPEDQAACDWVAKKIALHPVQSDAPYHHGRLN